jgi:single-stranded-DNA-specific exonuclease
MKYRWTVEPAQPLLVARLAVELRIPELLAQCLLNRGLDDLDMIGRFLEPRLKQLGDPFALPNMSAAVERLFQARERKEEVVIFGDYDVDGVTSSCLLLEILGRLGWLAHSYLPHRMDEGYGLTSEAVENCLRQFPATLILAVDCGSSSGAVISRLKERGVDVIVLDHHQISHAVPEAVAVVNPQLFRRAANAVAHSASSNEGNGAAKQAFQDLCSVGLAFKLAHAVVKRGRETNLPGAQELDLREFLDLVALGTIADIVPLTGENRILVAAGLERLRRTLRPGLVALKSVAQTNGRVGAHEVGFQLAPRLNAAGRLETATAALELLLARDFSAAMDLARKLDGNNRERQKIEKNIVREATEVVRSRLDGADSFVIVEGRPDWHIGVVGIVASRILRQFYRPTIIVGGGEGEWRGSGRSIAGFDLAAALGECGDLLVRHGGHSMAAGLTLSAANIDSFRQRLDGVARRLLKSEQLQPPLKLDAEVPLTDVAFSPVRALDRLKPTGQGNPPVQLVARNLVHQRPLQRVGAAKQHVKMWVTDGQVSREAVWWQAGEESLPVGSFDLAFVPQIEQFNGQSAVQLKVLDWQPAAAHSAASAARSG